MITFLSKLFIKNRDDVKDPAVRQAYGVLCGAVGILLNLFLFAGKFFAGMISNSIAITADALNNLSDAGSSIITLIGFRMACQKQMCIRDRVIPVLMADIIDIGVAQHDVSFIMNKGIKMGICAVLSLITGLLYARYAARASYGLGARIREAQYEKVQKYSFANLDHFDTSSLVTRMTTDVTVIQNSINGGLRPMVRGPVMLILGIGLSIWMNAKLAIVFLISTPTVSYTHLDVYKRQTFTS